MCIVEIEDAQYACDGATWVCIVVLLRTDMASLKRHLMQNNSGWLGLVAPGLLPKGFWFGSENG